MTTGDDDDDAQLRSLRAVWLAMPDEDPPERGLGELMAAARAKADELTRPSWLRRMLDTLRRPPVLALATIMVLVAGAVLVSQRKDEMEASPPAGAGAAPALVPPARPAATPGGNFGAASTAPAEEPPPAVEHLQKKTLDQAPPASHHDVSRAISAPTHKAALDTSGDPSSQAAPKPEPPRPSIPKPLVLAKPPAANATRGADAEPDFAKDKQGPALGQLLGQCRSAATHGDCAAARALARRIAQQDASYYRDNVAGDSSISSCLSLSE